MILALGLILLCQLLGEAIARGIGLPFPGPVLGLLICVGLLALRDRLAERFPARVPAELRDGTVERIAGVLLANLSLLFIPAGVGVVQRLDILAANGVGLVVALVVSTVLGLAVTALVFVALARLTRRLGPL